MPLPILNITSAPNSDTLVRYFFQTESNWTAHLAESTDLDFAIAWTNPQLRRVFDANRVLDVALPAETKPQAALELANEHFASRGATCWQWVMNPSAPGESTAPMIEYLLSQGYAARAADIMYLDRLPSSPVASTSEALRIIPARASFRHAQMIYQDSADESNEPQLVEAEAMHLNDPHYDALIALKDGQAVAHVGVLAVGEIGRIDHVHVVRSMRRRSIGATMMSRALEICARSLFKHVLLATRSDNTGAIRLYQKFGFRKIGQIVAYRRPA